jgi:hypothetical protein
MKQIAQEINQFYRVLGTECPKYRNITVTAKDLKNENILSEVLYDIEDNIYVYEGAEELSHKIRHSTSKKKAIHSIGIIFIALGFIFVLGTAGASDLGEISFGQIISQIAIGFGISTVGFIIKKMEA